MAQGVIGERRRSGSYPEGAEFDKFVKRRQGWGRFWHSMYFGATMVGIICLVALLANISNNAFGYVAIQYKVEPSTLLAGDLAGQPSEALIAILKDKLPRRAGTCAAGGKAAGGPQPGAALPAGRSRSAQAASCRKLDAARLDLQA